MTDYGKIKCGIWSDGDFTALNAVEQQVYLLLVSYPTKSYAGVLPLTLRRWSNATSGATVESVRAALARLAETRFIIVDWETEEVLIRTYIRNDEIYRQPNLMTACLKAVLTVQSKIIKNALREELLRLPDHRNADQTTAIAKSLVETPSEPFDEPFAEPLREGSVVVGYLSNHRDTTTTNNLQQQPPPSGGLGGTGLATPPGLSVEPKPRPRRGKAKIQADYMPAETVVSVIKAETGATRDQLRYQHRKFIDHWLKTGKLMADWDACWRNWMRTAYERNELGGVRVAQGADKKVMEYEQLKERMASADD